VSASNDLQKSLNASLYLFSLPASQLFLEDSGENGVNISQLTVVVEGTS
jgi:hypothetical protein